MRPRHAVVPHDRRDLLRVRQGGRGVDLPALGRARHGAPVRADRRQRQPVADPRRRPALGDRAPRRLVAGRRRSLPVAGRAAGPASRRSVGRRARTPRTACPCVPPPWPGHDASLPAMRWLTDSHGCHEYDHRAERMRQDMFGAFRASGRAAPAPRNGHRGCAGGRISAVMADVVSEGAAERGTRTLRAELALKSLTADLGPAASGCAASSNRHSSSPARPSPPSTRPARRRRPAVPGRVGRRTQDAVRAARQLPAPPAAPRPPTPTAPDGRVGSARTNSPTCAESRRMPARDFHLAALPVPRRRRRRLSARREREPRRLRRRRPRLPGTVRRRRRLPRPARRPTARRTAGQRLQPRHGHRPRRGRRRDARPVRHRPGPTSTARSRPCSASPSPRTCPR